MTPTDDHGPDPIIELLDEAEAAGIHVQLSADAETVIVSGPMSESNLMQRIHDQGFAVMQAWWKWQATRLLNSITDPKLRLDIFEAGHDVRARRDLATRSAREIEQIAYGTMVAALIEREAHDSVNNTAGD